MYTKYNLSPTHWYQVKLAVQREQILEFSYKVFTVQMCYRLCFLYPLHRR